MEITIKEIKDLKLSPSLIVFLKSIHSKDNSFLQELHKVSDLFLMGKHLEKLNLLKIVGNELSYESFEIRKNSLINYLDKEDNKKVVEEDIDDVIEYFKKITGKARIDSNSVSNRKFIKGRLSEGYSTDDLKAVALLKYNQWKSDPKMREYIRISTFYNEEKFQSYVSALDGIELKDFSDDI